MSSSYASWLAKRATAVFIASAVAIGVAGYLVAFHLPIRAAFSNLLPRDAPSVKAFDALAERLPARDTMLIVLVAPDAATRQAAAADALAAARAMPAELVDHIEGDDDATRAFFRARRHLFLPLDDLRAASTALGEEIERAKLRANPLYVDFDDAPKSDGLAKLRDKQREAEARLDHSKYISADGTSQVIIVRTAFGSNDVGLDQRLQHELDDLASHIRARYPTVQVGFTGGCTNTIAEHRALVHGVLLSTLITGVLVALVLLVHLRDVRILALVVANIAAATLVAFGIAALTVGHLNAATAFLGAIVAGNGINYGLLLVARYAEERRAHEPRDAMSRAIAGTFRPTLVASLGAAIAYGALGATKFRGFADFAWIGGIGMVVCWIASFTLLPALVLRLAPSPRRGSNLFGRFVVRAFGFSRPVIVCAVTAVAVVAVGVVSWRYVTGDPYEYDTTRLRSQAADAETARAWLRYADKTFERGLAGAGDQTYIALDDARDVPSVVAALRAAAAHDPIVGPTSSILDAVPADQADKLAILADIRDKIDSLPDDARADLAKVRPPDGLAPITARDLPPELATKLAEKDGRIGYIVAVRPGDGMDDTDGRDLIRFTQALRGVHLSDRRPITAAGGSLLFADVLLQIQRDGPLVTALAAAGLVVMVLLVVGRTRRAAAVLIATATGSLAMIAACALAGLKINFLDFVALPITLGLGIDYAINVADRAAEGDPRRALRSTGGTVLVCSLTTMIGYTSLLVSDNLGIRGFGLASLIGEITCVVAALAIVPAIVALRRPAAAPAIAPALRESRA
jgi:predicted RND superfamily exporter protein